MSTDPKASRGQVAIALVDKLIQWSGTAIVSIALTSALSYIRSMDRSINSLNVSVAQLVERSAFTEKAIDSLSARIQKLEERKKP